MKKIDIKIKVNTPKLRNDWGKVKPYTKIEENKKKKEELNPKYKKNFDLDK